MSNSRKTSRRTFLQQMAATSVVTTGFASGAHARRIETLEPRVLPKRKFAPNEQIRIATIGMGIIGFIDTNTALRVPGTELVAASDLYEGRRIHVKEVFGDHVDTYVDYREILARDDIDAVLVCTPDHWHAQMATDALQAGKAVYCEKPMVRGLDEGPDLIAVQEETGQVLQVGSQYASSILYDKARELIADGAIGTLVLAEAQFNRNSSIGAWQYSIPTDASPETVDWDRFLGSASEREFDPVRFFRWRNYQEYGTGIAGDLYVHLFTGIHHAVKAVGPTSVVSYGGVRYWKDGRDAPDVLLGLFDYPETDAHPPFTIALQTNFVAGGGGGGSFRFVGSEGEILVGGRELTLNRVGMHQHSANEILNGYNSVRTFSEAQQAEFARQLRAEMPAPEAKPDLNETTTFAVPDGYDDRYDHFVHFFDAIREDKTPYEDAVFGYRAAAPALLGNMSFDTGEKYAWDPVEMKLVASPDLSSSSEEG